MAHFASSVSIEESLDKVVAYTNDDEHLRRFVSTVEGRETVGEVTEWQRLGDRLRHRVEWKADAYRGWLEVNREGYVASVSVGVHTGEEDGAADRLDRALGELKAAIEAIDAAAIAEAEASQSFVVETVLKGLIRAIPAPQRAAMAPYLARARDLDGSEVLEGRRAAACVEWASTAGQRARSAVGRLAAEAAERVEGEADAALVEGERRGVDVFAKAERIDARALGGGELPAGFHERLNDAYAALKQAHKLASRHGWDAVPWPGLLEQLYGATS
jgi:hypothetical protein